MAYVNVKDWSVDQVTEWIKGLDNVILPYAKSFLNNGVNGHQLLNLRSDDLEHLGVVTLGHQEIILEAVEHLRNFHFELDKENLQMLALRLSCAANSLYKELLMADDDCASVTTQTMSDVHNIITTIKPLVCWLDRSPFQGDKDYVDTKTQLLQLSFEMATSAHRDIFSDQPNRTIRNICETLAKMADHIIQEISDPMILQPASLDLATLKKKEQELGFFLMPNNHAIHQIAEIKYGSPAHGSSKIEEGDEIVQVNYQTVVGWQRKKVLLLLQESPPEIVLTLKKRPRHTKVYGQIYMKPYRLPSKKRSQPYSRWNENLPSPQLLTIHDLPQLPILKIPPATEPQELPELSSSSDSETPDSPLDGALRMYPLKPRRVLQRRNTITGATPTSKTPYPKIEQYWQQLKNQAASVHSSVYNIDSDKFPDDSMFLRDKSASCSHGLELAQRPTTVIGLGQNRNANLKNTSFKNDFKDEKIATKKKVNFEDSKREPEQLEKNNKKEGPATLSLDDELNDGKSLSVNSLTSLTENIGYIDEGREITDRTSMATEIVSEIVENSSQLDNNTSASNGVKDDVFADVHIQNIIKKFDEQKSEEPKQVPVKPKIFPRANTRKQDLPERPDSHKKPAVPARNPNTKLRGRLDKSHSTPAYDLTPEDEQSAEKFVIESKQTIIEKKVETETIITTSKTIKYSAESTTAKQNSPDAPSEKLQTRPCQPQPKIEDVPPKPPPRTFPVLELPKKEPEPQKSATLTTVEHLKPAQPEVAVVKHFEFPDVLKATSNSSISRPLKSEYVTENCLKNFEPKAVSTPTSKYEKMDFGENEVNTVKSGSALEINKSGDSKVSPSNSINVRAMIYTNKNKSGNKKKNTLVAKRRKVTVNDLSPADIQGYLYQRLRAHQSFQWEKRWFVLSGSCLYGFKNKDSAKAACLIFLSGFTVAVANEVKSRSNAFKVYHTGTVFYFSAENQETLTSWIDLISSAITHHEGYKSTDNSLYSETDDSDSEKPKSVTNEKPPETIRKFGSLKKFTGNKKNSDSSSQSGSTSLDRKWFFHKSSMNSKNSVPVPTAQFRSYRKIRTASPTPTESVSTGNFTSHVPIFASRMEISTLSQNVSVPNLTIDHLPAKNENEKPNVTANSKIKQKNYVHASNPSLCNVSEFSVPSFSKSSKGGNDLSGFVTLEELMNRQAEERKLNPHYRVEEAINLNLIRPDVVYGEVPIRSKNKTEVQGGGHKKSHCRTSSDTIKPVEKQQESSSSSCFGKRLGSVKKSEKASKDSHDDYEGGMATYPKSTKGYEFKNNRSLPRTHKLQENQEFDGSTKSSMESLKFKDRSYEMIYYPQQPEREVQFAHNRTLDDRMYQESPKRSGKLVKQYSLTSADKKAMRQRHNASEESLFSKVGSSKVADSSTTRVKLKSALQYKPMSLPINQDPKTKMNPKFAFELNLDEKSSKSSKFKLFSKQGDGKKEKTFLGSPKLHRVIFHKSSADAEVWKGNQPQQAVLSDTLETGTMNIDNFNMQVVPHADYPGLEYPPIFEPETYSLADPQSSLTLLRKQSKQNP